MKYQVISISQGKVVSDCDISDAVFSQKYRPDILKEVIDWQLSKRRAGTHSTKNISAISGTTAKPFRQKGTGRARQGSLRSPQFRGGAVIFGPVVRSHAYSLNKKVRRMALKVALSYRIKQGDLFFVDSCRITASKTKTVFEQLGCVSLGNESVLLVSNDFSHDEYRVTANISKLDLLPVVGLNVYDIMRHKKILIDVGAIRKVEDRVL